MKTYAPAPDECLKRILALIGKHYPELEKVALRIDVLSATNSDEEKPAVSVGGYAALASIRILDTKARAKGAGDVEILIDELRYNELSEAERNALLDHEIYHIKLKRDADNRVKLDEHGRPKCGMRKHDFSYGWFREIAARHKTASQEVQQATRFYMAEKQTFFAFIEAPKSVPQLAGE